MLIVSQNKDSIINFDNMMDTHILDCEEDEFLISAAFLIGVDDIYRELGYYKTEERAKEVLQEIIKKYEKSMWSLGKQIISFEDTYVYEMPEK